MIPDKMDERRTERVWLRMGPTLKAQVAERARADQRHVADWIRVQIERELLESAGPQAPQPPPTPAPRGPRRRAR